MRGLILQVSTLPGAWCSLLPLQFPKLRIKVESHFPVDRTKSIEVVRLEGKDAPLAESVIRANPLVERVEAVDIDATSTLLQIVVRGCYLPHAVRDGGLLPSMPYEVVDSGHRWLMVGANARLQRFVHSLRKHGAKVRVLYAGEMERDGLTARQREVLSLAVRRGYYDYPRRASQTDLAKELGVSRAAVCEVLMKVEQKLVRETLDRLEAVSAGIPGSSPSRGGPPAGDPVHPHEAVLGR